jgi:hypothetical protein
MGITDLGDQYIAQAGLAGEKEQCRPVLDCPRIEGLFVRVIVDNRFPLHMPFPTPLQDLRIYVLNVEHMADGDPRSIRVYLCLLLSSSDCKSSGSSPDLFQIRGLKLDRANLVSS